MKKIIAIVLAFSLLLSACGQVKSSNSTIASPTQVTTPDVVANNNETTINANSANITENEKEKETVAPSEKQDDLVTLEDEPVKFDSLSDTRLLRYMEDTVTCGLVKEFASEDYIIENVSAIYYSKEYLEELAYNSQANIFFGYTLEDLDEQFQGSRYVFSLGDNGETIIQPFENYDDTYERIIKNVAIGTGVILICVTVSVATGGVGTVPISTIFAASAKTGTAMALSSGAFSAVVAGTVKGIQTGDYNEAMKAAALAGSEGFKWGAITGAIAGGVSEASALRNASAATEAAENATVVQDGIPHWRESEQAVLEKYGGKEQISFLNGVEVPKSTPKATRPDITRMVGDHIEAIEVKNYDLSKSANRSELYSELEREVSSRKLNLPEGSTQRIVLDVTGREFSKELVNEVMETITERLMDIYPNIPIDIMGVVV